MDDGAGGGLSLDRGRQLSASQPISDGDGDGAGAGNGVAFIEFAPMEKACRNP